MSDRILYRGATEIIDAEVTCADTQLTTQSVHFSFDFGTTWVTAAWQGSAGLTRTARATIVVSSVFSQPVNNRPVVVRVTDVPETPIIKAGTVDVR